MSGRLEIPGLTVGHASDFDALTGCTVILCPAGAVGGIDVRGSSPGTRQSDSLRTPGRTPQIHAILLTGGSAFGLDAATGVARYLEEQGVGLDVGLSRIPIVPAAVLFDLRLGDPRRRPDAAMGYQACVAASSGLVEEGSIGAGTGATVGKILGPEWATRAGIGLATRQLAGGGIVAALVAVNAWGDVVDPDSGTIVAGARRSDGSGFANTAALMAAFSGRHYRELENTVIGVVATTARLTGDEATKVAQMAQDGVARAVRPAHTTMDGDTIFALSVGNDEADVNAVGSLAADAFAEAILRGVITASAGGGLPAASDLAFTTLPALKSP